MLAGVPTFLLFALLRPATPGPRPHASCSRSVATALAIAVFAGIDLMRPATERAHLGRLVERVNEDGFGPLFAIVERKFVAALRESTRSFWALAIPIGIALRDRARSGRQDARCMQLAANASRCSARR